MRNLEGDINPEVRCMSFWFLESFLAFTFFSLQRGKPADGVMSEKDGATVARTVLQQCLQARLQVKPADEHSEAQFVQVRTGDRAAKHRRVM